VGTAQRRRHAGQGQHVASVSGPSPYVVTFDRDIAECVAVASPAGGGLQTVTSGVTVSGSKVTIFEINRGDGSYATGASISVAVFC
jgi:hypothetical protein